MERSKINKSDTAEATETTTETRNASEDNNNPCMTIFVSSGRNQKTNTSYPFESKITCIDDLKKAAQYDHVFARFADGKNNRGKLIKAYRSKKTFISSNCLPMDCDNCNPNPLEDDISESNWKTPDDVRSAFPNVPFYVVYSRNHMKEKNGKTARPRFHVYFPMEKVSDIDTYEKLKKQVLSHFPAFDDNAIDSARFFFGVDSPKVEYFAGDMLINDFIYQSTVLPAVIPSGTRNATLLSCAGKYLKRYGETEKAHGLFIAASERCDEPLDDDELDSIWQNAVAFYHNTIEAEPTYVLPEEYEADFTDQDMRMVTSDDVRDVLKKMGITVRLNVITGQVEITGMPNQYSKFNAPNTLPTLINDYFSKRGIRITRQLIDDSLVLIEDENRFNPVAEMLQSTKWDGVDRIGMLCSILGIMSSDNASGDKVVDNMVDKLVDASGDKVVDASGDKVVDNTVDKVVDNTINTFEIGENSHEAVFLVKWLHQCIAMALNDDNAPHGADGVLVLQAPQGTGKTFFCRTIAVYPDWFSEGVSIDLDNKDSIIQGTGVWISELGELDSTLKREQSALKAFITSARDTYRQPYAKVAVSKPRRTSFCATVNPKEFLNDETGSRRYWVIQPENIDIDKLKSLDEEWLRQMWKQVYEVLYLPAPQGFRLTEKERTWLQKNNEQFEKPLPGEVEILEKLCWNVPTEYWKWKKTSEVISDLNLKGVSPSQAGKALTKIKGRDNRVEAKAPHNVKQYLLPPMYDPRKENEALACD